MASASLFTFLIIKYSKRLYLLIIEGFNAAYKYKKCELATNKHIKGAFWLFRLCIGFI